MRAYLDGQVLPAHARPRAFRACPPRGRRNVASPPTVDALTPDGLLIRADSAFARYLAVTPTNPLALDAHACERLPRGLTDLITLVPHAERARVQRLHRVQHGR